jgi:hypothetical protein
MFREFSKRESSQRERRTTAGGHLLSFMPRRHRAGFFELLLDEHVSGPAKHRIGGSLNRHSRAAIYQRPRIISFFPHPQRHDHGLTHGLN